MQCVVCCEQLEGSTAVPQDRQSLSKLGNLYQVFRKYMHLDENFKNYFNFQKETFPFCRYCKLLLTQLLQLHEQTEYLSKLTTQITAQIGSMILATAQTNKKKGSGRPSKRLSSGGGKIENIRETVLKQYGASLKLPKDLEDQKTAPLRNRSQAKVEPTSFTFELVDPFAETHVENHGVDDDPDWNHDGENPASPADSFHGHDVITGDFFDPEGEDSQPAPVVVEKKTERVRQLEENKFIFENQIPFEILDGMYKCGACEFTCLERKELLCIHIPREHLGAEGERVPLVKQVDTNNFLYREKYPYSFGDELYHCGTCEFTSRRKDGILTHIKVRHFIGVERKTRQFNLVETEPGKFLYADKFTFETVDTGFKCHTCGSVKQRRLKMLLHIRAVHMDPLNVHSCDRCGKTFREKRKLLQHMSIHSDDRPFVCNICGKSFKLQIVLHTHLKRHEGETGKKHICDICGKKFWTNFVLKEHVTSHTGDKNFECQVCLRRFSRNVVLKNHMELHNIDKSFICELCGKSYPSQYHLNKHIALHNKTRTSKRKRKVEAKAEADEETEEATQTVEVVGHFVEL